MGSVLSRRKNREWTPKSDKSEKNGNSVLNGSRKHSVETTHATKIAANDLSSSNGEANKTVPPKADSSPKVTPEETSKSHESEPSQKLTANSASDSLATSTDQVPVSTSAKSMDESTAKSEEPQQQPEVNVTSPPTDKSESNSPVEQTTQTTHQESPVTEPSNECKADSPSEPAQTPASQEIQSPADPVVEVKQQSEPVQAETTKSPVEDAQVVTQAQDESPVQTSQPTAEIVPPVEGESQVSATENNEQVKSESAVPPVTLDEAVSEKAEKMLEEVTAEAIKLVESGEIQPQKDAPIADSAVQEETKSETKVENVTAEIDSSNATDSSNKADAAPSDSLLAEVLQQVPELKEHVTSQDTESKDPNGATNNEPTPDSNEPTKQLDNLNNNSNDGTVAPTEM